LAQELAAKGIGDGRIAAFVSAMGSAGTLAAADRIRAEHAGLKTVGIEPVQCPTLYNVGYGAHAIEGIGDKHVTWIHNVHAMDLLICIDDQQCLEGLRLFQDGGGFLSEAFGFGSEMLASLRGTFGVSGICNILGAIRTARRYSFGSTEPVFTVATDGFDRYPSVLKRLNQRIGSLDIESAERAVEYFLDPSRQMELDGSSTVRRRWHNQKYFTWVEQQGKTVAELDALQEPDYWTREAAKISALDDATLSLRESV
jgi:hypothetical protein